MADGVRREAMGTMLADWFGNHATTFRTGGAPTERDERARAVDALRENANEWGEQWARAVQAMNDAVYSEAAEEASGHTARTWAAYGYSVRTYWARRAEVEARGEIYFANPPREPEDVRVDSHPGPVQAPSSATNFASPATPFVAYTYDAAASRMVARAVSSPPPRF